MLKALFSLSLLMLSASPLLAQNTSEAMPDHLLSPSEQQIENLKASTHVISMGGDEVAKNDSIRKMLDMFYYDQYRHYQDPKAPYFMLMSRNGNLSMGIGGLVRLRGYFDWNGSIPANGFTPYLIPIPKDPTSMRSLKANAAGTGLFFTVFGRNTKLGDFMAYFQADFSGYQYRDFKLKKAYLTAGDWTAGLAKSTFEDTAAEPETIDGSGANGVTSHTAVLVRYSHIFKKRWGIGVGLEFPQSSTSADGVNTKACSDYVPDLAAYGQFQWNDGASHVRFSGLLRTLAYRDLLNSTNHNVLGWAAQFSTVVNVLPQMNLYGIASIGQGHESYTADLGVGNFDLIPEIGNPGKLYAPTAVGYVFGANYYFNSKVRTNLCLSEQRYYPRSNPDNSQYKYGLYGALNVFWDITPRFEVGCEYLAGKRMNFNGEHANANRLTAMMMLSF